MPNFSRPWPNNVNEDDYAIVIAFDPGETTGMCIMAADPEELVVPILDLQDALVYIHYEQIPCGEITFDSAYSQVHKHGGINLAGENAGISEMLYWAGQRYPNSVVVVEDFIPDPGRFDKARHTLSPVRLVAGFSFGMSCLENPYDGRLGDERIFVQDRANPKTTCRDDRLRNWGLYDRNSGGHARDASRHAFYFLRRCSEDSEKGRVLRHLAWPRLFADPKITIKRKVKREKKKGEII